MNQNYVIQEEPIDYHYGEYEYLNTGVKIMFILQKHPPEWFVLI
jgi:hypothetical protein